MADHESRSESPLSDIGSDAFTEDKFHRSRSPSNVSEISDVSDGTATPSTSTPVNMDARPLKRRRVGDYDHPTPQSTNRLRQWSPTSSISSDTDGSVPNSPSFANLGPTHPLSTAYAAAQANPNDPESADYTQVTRCQWAGCTDPEQGNMDNLVFHITEVHIPTRQKKYFCEWEGCQRKSMPHTSAYALKAHMRSHTKEKPFMCQVPECDRSFTRSDALAKHMRTVHETEALRPSDPVPRGHTGGIAAIDSKNSGHGTNGTLVGRKLKLTFKGSKSTAAETSTSEPKVEGGLPPLPTISTALATGVHSPTLAQLDVDDSRDEALSRAVDLDSVPFRLPINPTYYPPDIYHDMDDYERDLPPSQWFRLLRRQLRWATDDGKNLEKELRSLKAKTDDLRGNPVTKPGNDEQVGDVIRREEWDVVDNLLDRVVAAEYNATTQKLQQTSATNGAASTTEQNGEDKIFQKIQSLPYWRKQNEVVDDATTVALANAAA